VHGAQLTVAHVGDSRMYRLRGARLQQLTQDHSLLEDTIARGLLSRREAEQVVNRAVVTRALGGPNPEEVEAELQDIELQPGDVLLLCSDGLSDLLSAEAIESLLAAESDLPAAASALVEAANAAGGFDNISVVLVRIDS
jgi:protein phosphatase